MTNENYGLVEAFSFKKGVVKIDGHWFHFGREAEEVLRELKVGDPVAYVYEDKTLQRIKKADPKPAPKPTPVTPPTPTMSVDSRNKSIERQVALKAAVELADLYQYPNPEACLNVAAIFAAWIEDSEQFPKRAVTPPIFSRL